MREKGADRPGQVATLFTKILNLKFELFKLLYMFEIFKLLVQTNKISTLHTNFMEKSQTVYNSFIATITRGEFLTENSAPFERMVFKCIDMASEKNHTIRIS